MGLNCCPYVAPFGSSCSETRAAPPRSPSRQKEPVRGIGTFVPVPVAQLLQKSPELRVVLPGDLNPHENPAVVGPMVAVVEKADVPAAPHAVQEFEQGAGALGEREAEEALVVGQRRAPSDEVADVKFGHLVVGEIARRQAVTPQRRWPTTSAS